MAFHSMVPTLSSPNSNSTCNNYDVTNDSDATTGAAAAAAAAAAATVQGGGDFSYLENNNNNNDNGYSKAMFRRLRRTEILRSRRARSDEANQSIHQHQHQSRQIISSTASSLLSPTQLHNHQQHERPKPLLNPAQSLPTSFSLYPPLTTTTTTTPTTTSLSADEYDNFDATMQEEWLAHNDTTTTTNAAAATNNNNGDNSSINNNVRRGGLAIERSLRTRRFLMDMLYQEELNRQQQLLQQQQRENEIESTFHHFGDSLIPTTTRVSGHCGASGGNRNANRHGNGNDGTYSPLNVAAAATAARNSATTTGRVSSRPTLSEQDRMSSEAFLQWLAIHHDTLNSNEDCDNHASVAAVTATSTATAALSVVPTTTPTTATTATTTTASSLSSTIRPTLTEQDRMSSRTFLKWLSSQQQEEEERRRECMVNGRVSRHRHQNQHRQPSIAQ